MIAGFGKLPKNSLMQYPSGRWGFVGSVDARLAYVQQDGTPATDEQLETARHCGPGLAKLRTRTWETKEAAEQAASEVCLRCDAPKDLGLECAYCEVVTNG